MAPTELVNAELLLIDKKYNDIDCFLITQIFSLKEDALKLIYGALPLEVQKVLEVDTFYTLLPKKIEYYIGKDDYFIYDYATYNVEGKMLTRRSFLSVDFSQTFSPEEFDIPQDYEILTPYSISELSNESFISLGKNSGVYDFFVSECMKASFEPNVVCFNSRIENIIGLVSAGKGISPLMRKSVECFDKKNISIVLLKEKIYSTLSLVHLKDKNSSKVEKDFKKFLINNIQKKNIIK